MLNGKQIITMMMMMMTI